MKTIFKIKNMLIVLTIALLLEFCVFNFNYLYGRVNSNAKYNLMYTIEQMQFVNWLKKDSAIISKLDPNIILTGINTKVSEVNIAVDADKPIPNVVIFYTNNKHTNFSEQSMISGQEILVKTITIPINQQVKDLRIDLGDDAGSTLKSIIVTINPVKLDFSISRVLAILLIYLFTIGLAALQKRPDYQSEIGD